MLLLDLKVDTLNPTGSAHDLNSTEVGFEVVEDALGLLKEPLESASCHGDDDNDDDNDDDVDKVCNFVRVNDELTLMNTRR